MYEFGSKKVNHSIKLYISLILFFISNSLYSYMDFPYGVGFQIIQLPMLPLDYKNPDQGKISGRFNVRLINVWSIQTNRFITDGEEGQVDVSLRYAISDKTQIGFTLPASARGGGFMDEWIERFHRGAGITQGQRDEYPRNKFNVSYEPLAPYYPLIDPNPLAAYFARNFDFRTYPRNPNDPPARLGNQEDEIRKILINKHYPYLNEYRTEDSIGAYDAIGFANPRFYFQTTLLKGRFWYDKITAGSQIKIPMKSVELIGTPGTDISVFAVYHKDWFNGIVNWKFGISYSRFEMQRYRNLDLSRYQWVFRPSLVFNINERWQTHFEYVYYASPIQRWSRLSVPTHQVGFGISHKFLDYQAQFAVFENIFYYSNTPDIGFLISLEKFNLN